MVGDHGFKAGKINSASIIISPGQKANERRKEGVDRGRFIVEEEESRKCARNFAEKSGSHMWLWLT